MHNLIVKTLSKKRSKPTDLLLLALIVCGLVGCGGDQTAQVPPTKPTDKPAQTKQNTPQDDNDIAPPPVQAFSTSDDPIPGVVDTHVQPAAHNSGIPEIVQTSKEDAEFTKKVEELGIEAAAMEDQQNYAVAVEKRRALLAIIRAKYGDTAWQTTNAELSLEQSQNYLQMDAEQQARAAAISQYQQQALELASQNRFEDAIKSLGMAVSQCEAFWGPTHHLTARAKYRQAELYRAIGYYPQAVTLYTSALEIEDAAIGREHPRTIEVLNALAATAFSRGRIDEAEKWQTQAVAAAEKAYGTEAVEYSGVLRELGAVRMAQKRTEEAIEIYERVLQIRQSILGEVDPLVSESSFELARTLYQAERFDDAIAQFKSTIPNMNQTHGGANSLTMLARNNLAMAYVGKGEFEEAEEILLELLESRRTLVGDKHVDYATAQHHLAILYANQGDMPKAEPFVLSAMKIYQRKLGSSHPMLADVIQTYAAMLRHSGQILKAEQLEQTLREMADNARGVQGPTR